MIDSDVDGETWSDACKISRSIRPSERISEMTGIISPTKGDWVAWLGDYDDPKKGTHGQYRFRIKDNISNWDCCYPGVERLPNGTFVSTTYGHWKKSSKPYISSVHFTLDELDGMIQRLEQEKQEIKKGR